MILDISDNLFSDDFLTWKEQNLITACLLIAN